VEVTLRSDTRGYLKVKSAAAYVSVSVRTFRTWLKEGLPYSRLPSGTILVAYADIDAWLESFRVDGSRVDEIVDQVLTDL